MSIDALNRKVSTLSLGTVTIGGGAANGTIGVVVKVPSGKLRWSIEATAVDARVLLTPASAWTVRSILQSRGRDGSDGQNIFTALPLPDSFESSGTLGRKFRAIFTLAAVDNTGGAAAGQTVEVTAEVTWEPIDPQMSDQERAHWFSLCDAYLDSPNKQPLALRTA